MSGRGGVPTVPVGCEAAVTGAPAALHAAAASVLTTQGKCSFAGTCHDGPTRTAGLILLAATNLDTLLVDQPSCIAPTVPLVKSGGGEAALQGSWLWLKLVASADASGVLDQNAAWGAPVATCNQKGDQPYGVRMPYGTSGSSFASPERLAPIRDWICAGAPGP
jgi:hypothetical protein